jgi:HD-like signal output (HDOD) protein
MTNEQARQEIQQQKELPTLSPSIQRILAACEDRHVSQTALAEILGESPTIAARILGLANSAFFGQRDGVHSLPHAIAVLGTVMVRSVAAGLALAGAFDTRLCPGFHAGRFWVSAVSTAQLAQQLRPLVAAGVRPPPDSAYLAGLLHNIGLLALVHLHPAAMHRAFAAYAVAADHTLGTHIRAELGFDHYEAGVWLGSKWHFPRDLLLVMEHHYNPAYRGDHWPLVLMEGFASRWANRIIDARDDDFAGEAETLTLLGLAEPALADLRAYLGYQIDRVHAIAAAFVLD